MFDTDARKPAPGNEWFLYEHIYQVLRGIRALGSHVSDRGHASLQEGRAGAFRRLARRDSRLSPLQRIHFDARLFDTVGPELAEAAGAGGR